MTWESYKHSFIVLNMNLNKFDSSDDAESFIQCKQT